MTTMANFPNGRDTGWVEQSLLLPLAGLDPDHATYVPGLRVRILETPAEREAIAGLRRHAAFAVEQDLGLGLKPFEQRRDEIGLVTAAYRQGRPVATLRLVPTGRGLTGAERLLGKMPFDAAVLGKGSWEVGRVIMEPEDRHPDLLLECLKLTLEEVMQRVDVRHFHATTTLAMARLWRRVGIRTMVMAPGASGTLYALVHGSVEDVARALHLPLPLAEAPAEAAAVAGRGRHADALAVDALGA